MQEKDDKIVAPEAETEKSEAETTAQKKKDPEKLFPLRYEKYNSFYLLVVLSAAVALGVGIFVAVTDELLWGVGIFFAAIFIYVYFTTSELHEKLGIWYKTDAGRLLVTKCRARYGDVFYIPSRLIFYDVEELCDKAFFSPLDKNKELKAVFLPKTLRRIGTDVFASCESLAEIYFEGSEAEWAKIESATSLEGLTVIFDSTLPKKKKQS